jgi:membrane protein required for colicin V production
VNWLDILMAVLAAIFVLQGLRQGFTRLAIALVATLLGIILASWMYGSAGAFLIPYVSSKSLANIAGFLIVFIGVQLAGALLSWGLGRLYKWTGLTVLDRMLGAVFGVVKAALVGIVIVMILTAFPLNPVPNSIKDSRAAPYLIEASHVLVQLAPRELKDGFAATYDKIKKIWSGSGEPAKTPPRDSA